jgi:hypothetical protein
MTDRWDETWRRLRDWTNGQPRAERLAAQILVAEGYTNIDPSHPLGGPDGGKDAIASRNGERWIMAAYLPFGQQSPTVIRNKFIEDLTGVARNGAVGMAFVTNQAITLGQRDELTEAAAATAVDIFHLERVTVILDRPDMHAVRAQFLEIEAPAAASDEAELLFAARTLEENIEDLRHRVALAIPTGVFWVHLLVWNIFEEYRDTLKPTDYYKPVADAYRVIRELNEIVPADRLGTPIPEDDVGDLLGRVDQMAAGSAALQELITRLSAGGAEAEPGAASTP